MGRGHHRRNEPSVRRHPSLPTRPPDRRTAGTTPPPPPARQCFGGAFDATALAGCGIPRNPSTVLGDGRWLAGRFRGIGKTPSGGPRCPPASPAIPRYRCAGAPGPLLFEIAAVSAIPGVERRRAARVVNRGGRLDPAGGVRQAIPRHRRIPWPDTPGSGFQAFSYGHPFVRGRRTRTPRAIPRNRCGTVKAGVCAPRLRSPREPVSDPSRPAAGPP